MSGTSKLFKIYNSRFKQFEGKTFGNKAPEAEMHLERWPLPLIHFGNATVHFAVYAAMGYQEWQKFRVSMKTQPTELKLGRLLDRLQQFPDTHPANEVECIRINNYIAALRRGGHLNDQMEVIKHD